MSGVGGEKPLERSQQCNCLVGEAEGKCLFHIKEDCCLWFIYLFILFWSFGLKCLKEIIELRCGEIKKGIHLILEDLMMSENHPRIMIRWWLQCYELGTARACEPECACVRACVKRSI